MDSRRLPSGPQRSGYAPARAAEAVTLPLDGGTIVYHYGSGEVHRLDATGSIVWNLLDGRTPLDELIDDLAAGYGVDRLVVEGDVRDLVERLGEGFLLAGGPAPEPPLEHLLSNPPSP